MRRLWLVGLGALLLAPLLVSGQTTTITFTYSWTPPTTGSPVHHYEVQTSTDAGVTWSTRGAPTTASMALTLNVGSTYLVRVRAVDAQNRPGPWSASSDPNSPDAGPPGACGKPAWL